MVVNTKVYEVREQSTEVPQESRLLRSFLRYRDAVNQAEMYNERGVNASVHTTYQDVVVSGEMMPALLIEKAGN